jgi:hypothetical protein
MKCIHVIVAEGKAHARCNSGGDATYTRMYTKEPMLLSKPDLKRKETEGRKERF